MNNSGKLAVALFSATLLSAGPAVAQTQTAAAGTQAPIFTETTVSGAVRRIHGGEFELQSGQTVYITDATVIKPANASLSFRPVTVKGFVNNEDGSINATEIDVAGESD